MELKYVVPNMEKTFGNLEFAGEKEVITARDDKKGKYIAKRSYNLYSDVQKRRKCRCRNSSTSRRKEFSV